MPMGQIALFNLFNRLRPRRPPADRRQRSRRPPACAKTCAPARPGLIYRLQALTDDRKKAAACATQAKRTRGLRCRRR
jgi:hypothetical protein